MYSKHAKIVVTQELDFFDTYSVALILMTLATFCILQC